jgi:hypothetical protein
MSVRILHGINHREFSIMEKLIRERDEIEEDLDRNCNPEERMFLMAKLENINKRISDVGRF